MEAMRTATGAGESYSNQLDFSGAQTKELFQRMSPNVRRSVNTDNLTGLTDKVLQGALAGMEDLYDLSDKSVTAYLTKYLTDNGVEGSAADIATAAGQLDTAIRHETDKKAGGMGMVETFGMKRAKAAAAERKEAFADTHHAARSRPFHGRVPLV